MCEAERSIWRDIPLGLKIGGQIVAPVESVGNMTTLESNTSGNKHKMTTSIEQQNSKTETKEEFQECDRAESKDCAR